MKKINRKLLSLFVLSTTLFLASSSYADQPTATTKSFKAGVVNTKRCLEESKQGKQEQANFEKLKAQMESILQEKEKELEEVETKLIDDDYMDSISEDAANELKRKKRTIRQDGMQLQNQYLQTLQQANVKVIQKLADLISKASTEVAKDPSAPLDLIFSDEACTYFDAKIDVTNAVIAKMDVLAESEKKEPINTK